MSELADRPIVATTSRRGWTPARRSGPARRRCSRPPGAGPSATMLASSWRVRSRRALRATHNRNRYSTIRKPNFSATATGSVVILLLLLEGQSGEAQRDLVAGLQHCVLH